MIFFSIKAANGNQLKSWLIRCQAQIPSRSPCIRIKINTQFKTKWLARVQKNKCLIIDIDVWYWWNVPCALCIQYGNQIRHLYQQLHDCLESGVRWWGIQSVTRCKHNVRIVELKCKRRKQRFRNWFVHRADKIKFSMMWPEKENHHRMSSNFFHLISLEEKT